MATKSLPRQNVLRPGEVDELRPSTTITAATIRNAYVYDDRNSRRQIEEHGKLNRKILRELIRREATEPDIRKTA